MSEKHYLLIIDDDVMLRRTLTDILREEGYAVGAVATGSTALKRVKQRAPAVALVDLKLEDMSGLEVVKQIKRLAPETECLMLTGHATVDAAIDAVKLGAYGFMTKPYDISQLLIEIARAVEKRETRHELVAREQQYTELVENLEEIIFQTDYRGHWTFLNPAWARVTGYTVAESLGTSYLQYVHPDDRVRQLEAMQPLLAGEQEVLRMDLRYLHKNGQVRWLEGSGRLLHADDGTITGTVGTLLDVTERKAAEQSLSDNEEKLRLLFDGTSDLISIADATARTRWANPAWKQLFGSDPQRMVNPFRRLHPDDIDRVANVWQEFVAGGGELRNLEYRIKRPDGTYLAFEASAYPVALGGEQLYYVIAHDVTDRHLSEAALRESEERFRSLVQTATDAIVGIDERSRITLWNRAATRLFGFTRKEALGAQFHTLIVPERHRKAARTGLAAFRKGHKGKLVGQTLELTGLRKDGSEIPIELSVSRVKRGDLWHATGVIRDLTARQQAEAELADSEARLRATQESLSDKLFVFDREGRFIDYHQPAGGDALFVPPEQFLGRPFTEVLPPPVAEQLAAAIDSVKQGAACEEFECQLEIEGESAWYLVRVTARRDARDELVGFTAVARNITPLKRAEAALRRTNRALKVLSQCDEALVRASDEEELLGEVCRILVEHGDYRLAWVGYAERDRRKTVRPVAQAGHEEGYLETLKLTWADTKRGRGPAGTAIRTGEPYIAQDLLTNPDFAPWRKAALERGYAATIALPLASDEKAFGVLVIYATEPDAFDEEETKLLFELASDLAYGIVSLRARGEREVAEAALRRRTGQLQTLLAAAEQLNRELEVDRVLRVLVATAMELTDATAGAAGLMRDGKLVFTEYNRKGELTPIDYTFARGEGVPGHIIATRKPYFTNDTTNDPHIIPEIQRALDYHNLASVPILGRDGTLLGCFGAHNTRDRRPFDDHDIEMLGGLADLAAVALENALLLVERAATRRQLTESEARFRALYEASPDGVLIDQQGVILYANPSCQRIFGLADPQAQPGQTIEGIIAPHERERVMALSSAREAGEPAPTTYVFTGLRADGSHFPCEVTAARFEHQGRMANMALVRDISERRKQEEALEALKEFNANIIETSPIGIHVIDRDFTVRSWNSYFEQYTGIRKEEIVGQNLFEAFPGLVQREMDWYRSYTRVLDTGEPLEKRGYRYELPTGPRKGKQVYQNAKIVPLKQEGRVVGAITLLEDVTEQRRTKEALRESELRFQALFEASPDAVLINQRGKLLYFNPACLRMFGIEDPQEWLGKPIEALIAPDDRERVTAVATAREAGEEAPVSYEFHCLRADGTTFPVEVTASRFEYRGRPANMAILRDITERRASFKALQESEQRYQDLYHSAPDLYATISPDGTILDLNETGARTLGYARDELVGQHLATIIPPDSLVEMKAQFKHNIEASEPIELEAPWRHKDGSTLWFHIRSDWVRDDDGNVLYSRTVARDITDRREALAALRRSEARYRSTIDSMKDIVFGIDRDGRFRDYYGPVDAKLHVPSDVFIGKHFEEMLQPHVAASLAEAIDALAAGARSREFEYSLEMDGYTYWYYAVVSGRRDAEGVFDGVTAVVRDITAHKNMEAQLIQSERLAAIGEVSTGVAHELNTPLANISLLADNLIEMGDDEDIKAMARQTQEQVDFAARIVQELLNFARPATYEFTPLDLNVIIETSLAQLQTPDNVAVDFDLASELLAVRGDRYQLQEIITNLANNAFYAMRQQPKGRLTVTTRPRGEWGELVIVDTGTGISSKHLPRVFDPFYSTKPTGHGTGLGLSIVQRIVNAHGGTISVESEPGQGATFTIRLPFLTEEDEADAAAAEGVTTAIIDEEGAVDQ